jgi:hypothetical protein
MSFGAYPKAGLGYYDSYFKVEQNDKVKKIVLLKPLVGFAKEKKLKKLLSGWKNALHFSILFYNKIKYK